MLFSIITAAYNAERLIESTIKSVLSQSILYDLEYIIVDGNSEDGTLDIIKKYAKQYPNTIKYISEPDKGIYDALNKGIIMSEGMYINFQGAGDCLVNDILKDIIPYTNEEYDMIYGKHYSISHRHSVGREFDKYMIAKENIPHQATFYKRTLFNLYGLYNINYVIASDYAYNIKLMGDDSVSKIYVDKIISNYLDDGISVKGKDRAFVEDLPDIIRNELGEKYFRYYVDSGCAAKRLQSMHPEVYPVVGECVIWRDNKYPYTDIQPYKSFIDYAMDANGLKAYIFGCGQGGVGTYNYIKKKKSDIEVLGFIDNDLKKVGAEIGKIKVYSVEQALKTEFDCVIVASEWKNEILKQLTDIGLNKESIIISY